MDQKLNYKTQRVAISTKFCWSQALAYPRDQDWALDYLTSSLIIWVTGQSTHFTGLQMLQNALTSGNTRQLGCVQKDLCWLKKLTNSIILKSGKGTCKVLYLKKNNPLHCYRLGAALLEFIFAEKNLGILVDKLNWASWQRKVDSTLGCIREGAASRSSGMIFLFHSALLRHLSGVKPWWGLCCSKKSHEHTEASEGESPEKKKTIEEEIWPTKSILRKLELDLLKNTMQETRKEWRMCLSHIYKRPKRENIKTTLFAMSEVTRGSEHKPKHRTF